MIIARQSTARTVTVGPVLDADGVAVTNGVVGDFKIAKNGGAPAALNGSATLTHRHTGFYSLALTTSDLDTVGQAEIVIDDTVNACPMKEITVVEEAVYDALFAASAAGYSTLDAAGIRTAVGLASANLDTQLSTIDTNVDDILVDTSTTLQGELDGIQADTEDIQSRLPAALVAGRIAADAVAISGSTTAADNVEANIGNLDAAVSTRLATSGYTAPLDAAGVRTAVGLASANLDTQLAAIDDAVDTEVAAIKAVTDKLDTAVELDGAVYRFTTNALEQAPTGSGASAADIADAVWTEAIADHSGTAGSTAEALAAAGAAGDPWITALPGSYSSGQAGFIIGTNLNATVSSRATQTSVDTIDGIVDDILVDTGTTLQAELDGIQADTEDIQSRLPAALVSGRMASDAVAISGSTVAADAVESNIANLDAAVSSRLATAGYTAPLDAAGVRTAVGLATANLDTQLSTIDSNVDAVLADTGTDGVIVATNNDKTGYSVGTGGIGASAFAAGAINAAAIDADAIGASELASDAVTEIASGVFSRTFSSAYNSHTFDELVKLMAATLLGKVSGMSTTEVRFRNLSDGADVVVATVDADGNRSAVTRTP